MRSTRWCAVGALIAATAVLAGCGASSPEDAYIKAVGEKAPAVLDRGSREELIELGHTICGGLDDGTSAYDLADGFVDLGWSVGESGTVVVQAAKTLCPEHVDAVS